METIQSILPEALTAMRAPQTPAQPICTAKIKWDFETAGEPQLAEMLAASQRFADEMKSGMTPRWLSMLGKSGIGKTHLATKLFGWCDRFGCFFTEPKTGASNCHPIAFASWRRTADRLRNGEWGLIKELADKWFLVIDDLGAEFQGGSGAVKAALERLIDDRLGKWTVITSNLYTAEIAESIDTRISSRMLRGGSVIIQAKAALDYSLRKKQARKAA